MDGQRTGRICDGIQSIQSLRGFSQIIPTTQAILTCWLRIEISGTAPTGLHGLCTEPLMPSVQSISTHINVDTESAWLLPPRIYASCIFVGNDQKLSKSSGHMLTCLNPSNARWSRIWLNLWMAVSGFPIWIVDQIWIKQLEPDWSCTPGTLPSSRLTTITVQVAKAAVRLCIVLDSTLCLPQLLLDSHFTFLQFYSWLRSTF